MKKGKAPSTLFWGVALLIPPVLLWAKLILDKHFDADEMQHAHAVYLLGRGMLPYADFFEHHPPLLYFFALAPYKLFGPKIESLFVFRGIMGVSMLLTLAGLFFAGRSLAADAKGGLLSALAWAYLLLAANKGIEFRPDPPALACAALGMGLYLHLGGAASRKAVLVGALLWGLALAFTQKMIFPFLGFSLFHFFSVMTGERRSFGKFFLASISWFTLASIPFIISIIPFAFQAPAPVPDPWYSPLWVRALPGALPALLDRVVFWNLRWANRFSPLRFIYETLRDNLVFWLLAAGGGFIAIKATLRSRDVPPAMAPALTAFGAIIGAFAIPVPYRQYFLCAALPCAVLAGFFARDLISWISSRIFRGGKDKSWAAALIVVGLLVIPPALNAPSLWERNNKNQVEAIRFFTTRVPPDWPVLDGWTGFAVFNPSPWYYHFLHLEIRKMLPPDVQEQAAEALQNTRIVIRDADVRALPKHVQDRIDEDFVSGGGLLWFRRAGR